MDPFGSIVKGFNVGFGSRITEERTHAKLSQAQAAQRCGVSREMWGKYERGIASPGAEVLARLSEAGMDVLYILTSQRLSAARETEGSYMIRAAAEREARGEPPIPGLVEALQGLADTDRRIAARADSMALVNHYLSALDDEAYQAALEMLRRYGLLRADDRLVVNRMVAGLAADRR